MIDRAMVDKSRMKQSNRRLALREIYAHPGLSRPMLSRSTGMSVMSAGRIADELIAMGLIENMDAEPDDLSMQGRPAKKMRVRSESLLCLGLTVDRDGVTGVIADPYGRIARSEHVAFSARDKSVSEVCDVLATLSGRLSEGITGLTESVGVSVPGLVDPARGVVGFSSQLNWRDLPLAERLSARLPGRVVVVDNDIKAQALAESRFGAARGYGGAALLSIGSGIGAAVIIGGEIYRGRNNLAGEIGHVTLSPTGRMCECGRIGCLQTSLADWAVLQEVRAIRPEDTLDDLFIAYEREEKWARALVARTVDTAAVAMNLLVNAYAPEVVVLCGSMVFRYPAFRALLEGYRKQPINAFAENAFDLRVSELGASGGAVGAAAVAFQKHIEIVTDKA